MARERQRMGVKNERTLTLGSRDVIHLDGLERMIAGEQLFELLTQRGKLKGAIPELVEWGPLRIIARDLEHCVEGAIARLDPLVSAQHDERIGDRVEDRLR